MATNNPIGSNSVEDFQDNSIILDHFVNSQNETHPDRFGKQRPTITGIIKEAFSVRQDINNFTETLVGMSRWDPIPKNTSLTLGGDNGGLNKQAQALFNRTEMLKVHSREALRRTYLEAGLILVPGSFEQGGELKTIADILLEEKTGKCYSWSGSFPKVVTPRTLPTSEVEFVDKTNSSVIENIQESLDELEEKIGESRKPVLSIEFIQKRSAMWPGHVPGDGGTFSRTTYPSAFKAIQDGLVPVCTEAEWLTDPGKRGCFTLGDGSTTFRIPDYNGAYNGSYGPAYLGGGISDAGKILRDRIQNFTGGDIRTLAPSRGNVPPAGVFKGTPANTIGGTGTQLYDVTIDISLMARTGDTTRPITAEGCWGIKLFGAVINESNVDAAYLASEVANLTAKVNSIIAQLAIKREVCLVNALGTGINNEIVEPLITPTITISKTITVPNPFGNNTPVICIAEIKYNDEWGQTGFVLNTTVGGYGLTASYVQGKGIVIQTGNVALTTLSVYTGNPFNITAGNVTVAPFRIRVIKNL